MSTPVTALDKLNTLMDVLIGIEELLSPIIDETEGLAARTKLSVLRQAAKAAQGLVDEIMPAINDEVAA